MVVKASGSALSNSGQPARGTYEPMRCHFEKNGLSALTFRGNSVTLVGLKVGEGCRRDGSNTISATGDARRTTRFNCTGLSQGS